MSRFQVTPTMWDFVNDNSFVRVIAGAIGSGKSVLCVHELVRMAVQQKPNERGERLTRTLIVRNTFDQLKTTVMKTWFSWLPHGEWGIYKAGDKTFFMDHALPDGTRVKAEFLFVPLDTPDDVRKALSLELTFLWANEWREIHPEVVDGLLMRLRRYPSMKDGGPSRSCAIFDTNMPDLDTWHFDKMENPPANWSIHLQPPAILNLEEYLSQEGEEPDANEATPDAQGTSWWLNPRADNLHNLDARYYPDIIPGKSEDFINVYLRCRYGRSLSGVPVFDKTFNPEFHIAETPFTPLKSPEYPLIVGLDLGRTPATALLQRNAWGQLVVLDELTSENMGIETFLDRKLAPLLTKEQYLGCHVVVAPDPAGWAKQQIGEVSPVDIIKQRGFKVAKPVTNDPKRRIEAVERVLLKHVDGKPAFVVNPQCKELIKGFRYGYRYKVNRTGVQDDKPEKNASSHCLTGDTLVSTPKGPVRIDTIRLGDVVSTPLGPQRVTATMDRVVDFVYELTFTNGVLLRCTGDHPVSTTRGLVLADALQYSDVLQTERASRWKTWLSELSAKSLSSTESGTTVGQAATSLVYQSSVGQTLGTVTCIAPSGVITMEIYPKAWLFTTKITTKPITTLKTLSCCTVANMARTTTANALKLAILPLVSLYQQQWKLQKPGIDQKKGWRGTESTANACSATGKKSLLFASIVEKTTKLTCKLRDVAFALWPASPPLDEPPAWTTLSARALSVARRLLPTNTQKQRHAVRLAARSRLDGPVRVYDLTVEKAHEFYANGILVGNCMDGLQYGVLVAETGAAGSVINRGKREIVPASVSSRAWT